MKVLKREDLYKCKDYITLKKLGIKTAIRKGDLKSPSFKGNYLINQEKCALANNKNYTVEKENGAENLMYYTEDLNNNLLVEVVYSKRSGDKGAKIKVYLILDGVKYVLTYAKFIDTYKDSLEILKREINSREELSYIEAAFKNLEVSEVKIDIKKNLERLEEFIDRANYKRNIDYFVINNTLASTTKFKICDIENIIKITNSIKVLRYNSRDRLYSIVREDVVKLRETDLIVEMGKYTKIHIYTEYGWGKLLDIENNVIPTKNNISLFANILDLGISI